MGKKRGLGRTRYINFETRKYTGGNVYGNSDEPGKRVTFSPGTSDQDDLESLLDIQVNCFNEIIAGADLDKIDFSPLVTGINGLSPTFSNLAAFLLDTLTMINNARIFKNKASNLAEQLDILHDDYEQLKREYEFLKEHCDEISKDEEPDTGITICTNVTVGMDLVYTLYQHFFGYPIDGIWDEEKANLIRRVLERRSLSTVTVDGQIRKIRHVGDSVKIQLKDGPAANLQVKLGEDVIPGDDSVKTNSIEIYGMTEKEYGLTLGQTVTIEPGEEKEETRVVIDTGSIILNRSLEFDHAAGSLVLIGKQRARFKYLKGTITKVNDKFKSYDIDLRIGGTIRKVIEVLLEDDTVKDPCPEEDEEFDVNLPSYVCQRCYGEKNHCGCTIPDGL